MLLALLSVHVLIAGEFTSQIRAQRASVSLWPPGDLQQIRNEYGSVEQYLDLAFPLPNSARFYQARYGDGIGPAAWVTLMWLTWPWLTFLALLVFQISMRRARVRPAHVLRCVLYSWDAVFWIGLLFAGGVATRYVLLTTFLPTLAWPGMLASILPAPPEAGGDVLVVCGAVLTVVAAYRLVVAFREYLRFDRPVATVLSSQVIVLLSMVIVSLLRIRL